ncbi:hypothetical protein O6H91_14G073100 [Diphasiastrum complanatum]|uniref:Uncharacterized protein n=7 Tax=Diphasiastrum complanatum TaxID=34168 RepID=A0ACC2BRQ0_DIPCM|nr:hypothetical protein O6H91_14G072200 [Diphasiastrum complanatum]KAJ7532095.1 hypothetical protein O6H91_14G072200 [Diphasiastrum complanatum]KAJ7532096.1 hypothetical protein O6H91_14G072200 [Diphasiastrum complanatum]KAJ7532097.1 hypothetical protein O6H91_14G072200 [Diphasiastrum complanatum]KAJ7532118.1 hypothetical protein O6H91_14G073100 [Diphasiastrum complanatum]
MDLSAMQDAFDRVSKKQKVSYSKTQEIIDKILEQMEQTIEKFLDGRENADADHKILLSDLQGQLTQYGPLYQLGALQKELNLALSKYGKVMEKQFSVDIAKAYREMEFDSHLVNQAIALHFYRQGLFELGDSFVDETQEPNAASLKAPFYEMYQILEAMKSRKLELALEWARLHQSELDEKGSSLEFKLHQLQFVHVLLKSGCSAALQYARNFFGRFASQHMGDIQRTMGCLLWARKLESSPYADLLSSTHWEAVSLEFTRECCSLLGQAYESPLNVIILAGCQALPTLLKLATVMANKRSEWQALKQLPVEIELDKEFQFHSIFACPVSRDQSTAENPPMLMPCGHVLCKQSILKLAKGSTRLFKCPYCPLEATVAQCRQIYF